MTHTGQLVAYLLRRFAEGSSTRVFGDELPESVSKQLDQPSFDPVVCVETRPSPGRDILTLEQLRFDIFCIDPTFDGCHRRSLELRDFMDELSEAAAGASERVKSAVRESGPNPTRHPDTRRPSIHTSWIVSMDAHPAPD